MQNNATKAAKNWVLRDTRTKESEQAIREIAESLKLNPVLARLLYNRGYTTGESARAFLCMESEMLCDPFLMPDIRPAVERIRQAVQAGEKITIYGDYDVDGVTSVCALYLYLREHGATVDYYIPNRIGEGYGVSCAAVRALAEGGTRLLVTVDTGITARDEVECAREVGMDVVVTDHHECRAELPRAVAVVNPHRPDSQYPFCDLAGVGVVFKLLCAYEEIETGRPRGECVMRVCRDYGDLVAIGTIADVMPIRSENKLIVSYGLDRMEKEPRMGLCALIRSVTSNHGEGNRRASQKAGKISSSFVGYTLAPRLNAAGRIRTASLAAELFLTEDPKRADALAAELCEANRERQSQENAIMTEAYQLIEREHDFERDPVIVLAADHWHHGVIGIVASRITEHYGLPCLLISFEGCEGNSPQDVGKGSGRSIKGMNLVDALMHCSEHLVKFGGHELAAGLSVTREELSAFKAGINAYARTHLSEQDMTPTLEADCELTVGDISMNLAEELRMLEPYGVGNPTPTFVWRGATVREITPVGGGKHTRLSVGEGRVAFTAMCFSRSESELDLFVGDSVDLMFTLDINEWNGRKSVQLVMRDVRLAERVRSSVCEEREEFERIWHGGSFLPEDDILPSRDDFAAVYTLVRRSVRAGCECLSHRAILSGLSAGYEGRVGYIKLKFIIRILQEMNLLGIEEESNENYRFHLRFSATKTDLEKSNLLRRLRVQMKQA